MWLHDNKKLSWSFPCPFCCIQHLGTCRFPSNPTEFFFFITLQFFLPFHKSQGFTSIAINHTQANSTKQKINFELRNIVHWLRANKFSLNTKKTEIVLFRVQKTIVKKNMNFQISGQKVNMKETKYLGMIINEHLTFKNHMDTVKLKLNRANGLLAKLRHYVNPALLKTIYYAPPAI